MLEVLNNPPLACSVSTYMSNSHSPLCCSIRHDFRINFQCISSSGFGNWNMTLKPEFAKNHTCRVVPSAERSRSNTWPRTTEQRIREKVLMCKSVGIDHSGPKPNAVVSPRLESVCEGERVRQNCSQQILVPWSSFSDQELEDQNHSDNHSRMLVKTISKAENEVYYLEERNEEILSKRILKLSRTNKVRSALQLHRSMVTSGLLPNSHACNSLLACLLRNGRLDAALEIFEFVKSSEIITAHTYSLILKAVANAWGHDKALRMFEEANRDSKTKSCIDTLVYNTMIAIFGKTNDWVQAERMWRSLQTNRIVGTVITYRMLVCIFVRCGQNELALDAYHEMAQNEFTPGDDAMEAVIGACAREGKWDIALNVLQSLLNSDTKPSLTACNALISSLGKASQIELAFNVFDLVKKLGHTPDAYTWNALIGALNKVDRDAEALQLFEHIRREHGSILNLHVYNTCLKSCHRLGLWDRALQLLWEMEASRINVSVTSYNLVIAACEAARKPKVALQVYDHMVRQNKSPDIFTLLSLIRGCIWGSLWDEMEKILDTAPNGSIYNAAIQGACLRSKTDLARKLYARMREIGLKPDGKTRALMLQNLPKR